MSRAHPRRRRCPRHSTTGAWCSAWRQRRHRRRGGPRLCPRRRPGVHRGAQPRQARCGGAGHRAEGGRAEAAVVDALDEQAMVRSRRRGGRTRRRHRHRAQRHRHPAPAGTPSALSPKTSWCPCTPIPAAPFLTAKAVAPHMAKRGGGVILSVSTPASRLPGLRGYLGHAVACAGRGGVVAPHGRRAGSLQHPHGVHPLARHSRSGVRRLAFLRSVPPGRERWDHVEQMLADSQPACSWKRPPSLDQMAAAALFAASEGAGAMTGRGAEPQRRRHAD